MRQHIGYYNFVIHFIFKSERESERERQTTLVPTGLILCEFQAPFRQVSPTACYSQNNTFNWHYPLRRIEPCLKVQLAERDQFNVKRAGLSPVFVVPVVYRGVDMS